MAFQRSDRSEAGVGVAGSAPAGSERADVARRVAAIFHEVCRASGLDTPELGADTVLDSSLGLESVDFAEIVVRLEAEFGIDPFAQGEVPSVITFGDLVALYA